LPVADILPQAPLTVADMGLRGSAASQPVPELKMHFYASEISMFQR